MKVAIAGESIIDIRPYREPESKPCLGMQTQA